MKAKKHLHSYAAVKGRKNTYMCTDPECTHFTQREFLLGKKSLCPKCFEPFILTFESFKRKVVICDFCGSSESAKKLRKIKQNIEKISANLHLGKEELNDLFGNGNPQVQKIIDLVVEDSPVEQETLENKVRKERKPIL